MLNIFSLHFAVKFILFEDHKVNETVVRASWSFFALMPVYLQKQKDDLYMSHILKENSR